MPRIAVVLFAAILTVILCSLQVSIEREKENHQHIYSTVKVPVHVSNLTGTSIERLAAPQWVVDAIKLYLHEYIEDVAIKGNTNATWIQIGEDRLGSQSLIGISKFSAAGELSQMPDGSVIWLDGFEESMLQQDQPICILPEVVLPANGEIPASVTCHFESTVYDQETEESKKINFEMTFAVAGYHKINSGIYCPVSVVVDINRRLDKIMYYDRVGGMLIDNSQIEQLREAASEWFVAPNLSGEKTAWNEPGYSYHPYALKIDDSQLRAADEAMERSYTINRICTVVVFVLSAAAGFVIGFLMVRSRKKEIALMRTMGTPNRSVYFTFVLEQMLCVILGIVLGGAYNQWQPMNRLCILAAIYFVGMTVALLIFLRKNLLTTIKEDE